MAGSCVVPTFVDLSVRQPPSVCYSLETMVNAILVTDLIDFGNVACGVYEHHADR
jgi:hypothetical protein